MAASKDSRVRVEAFSKISTSVRPANVGSRSPRLRRDFSATARSKIFVWAASGRSLSVRKCVVIRGSALPGVDAGVLVQLQAHQLDEALRGAVVELVLLTVGGERVVVDADGRGAP